MVIGSGLMKKTMKSFKGFTLIELIVVIAIIAVLACILVPAMSGHIKNAERKVDMQNARQIAEAVDLTLLMDDAANEAFYKHNTARFNVSCNGESYGIVVVAKINGTKSPGGGNADAAWKWQAGNNEAIPFADALSQKMGFDGTRRKVAVALKYNTLNDGRHADRYIICYRDRDKNAIEIWSADSRDTYGCKPRARLYPSPDNEYLSNN